MPNEREINKLADKFRQSSVEVIINAEGERRWYTLTEQESKHLADISINYRAELTAPAEGDVEAARECILPDDLPYPIPPDAGYWNAPHRKRLVEKIVAALTTARQAERAKWEAAAKTARSFIKGIWDDKFISAEEEPVVFNLMISTLKELDAALVGEGKGEEVGSGE